MVVLVNPSVREGVVMEKGFIEKALLIIVVGYLASKLIYPLLDSTVGRFLRLA